MGIGHLTARFFTSLSSEPPAAADVEWAHRHLTEAEQALWDQQCNQDQRHSAGVARRFSGVRSNATQAEIAGALLHDVGKIECGLGTFSRVAATIVGSRGERFRAYHDHEAIGARMAADVGSDQITVQLIAGSGEAYTDLHSCDHA